MEDSADQSLERGENSESIQIPPPPPALKLTGQTFKTARDTFKPVQVHFAVNNDSVEELQELIDSGTSLDYMIHGNTPLTLAIIKENIDVAHALIKGGADVSKPEQAKLQRQPVHLAAQLKELDVLQALVEHGANVQAADDMLFTPLHYACVYGGGPAMVQYLLDQGAHINARDDRGRTPMFRAVEHGCMEVVRLLHTEGGSVNLADNYGWTPLHQAVICCQEDMVEELLTYGTDVLRRDNQGNSVLHAAISRLSRHNARILMLTSPNYYTRNLRAVSPSFQRALNAVGENESVVYSLLDYGANINIRNFEGKTPFELAAEEGHVTIMKLLLGAGADLHKEMWLLSGHWPRSIHNNQVICGWLTEKVEQRFKTLTELCKHVIRKSLVPHISCKIPGLPLPPKLVHFLDIV